MNILTNVTVGFEIPGENKKVQNCLLTFVNKESNKDAALTSRDDTCGLRTTPLARMFTPGISKMLDTNRGKIASMLVYDLESHDQHSIKGRKKKLL